VTIIGLDPDHPRTRPGTHPEARADRWQPTRAGLIGLWHYWEETFTFHRGRLLLRGPNGTGKSMALELLLPFLLDGDTAPHRLTSAARSRGTLYDRMMAGATDPARAGFAWVEFRRAGEVFTAGARMRASSSTRQAVADFFTTDQAVGQNLHLLDARREPLSRKDLDAALDGHGRIHRTRDEHRTAVRTVLFPGLNADRYESVIGTLLALRREKLSQNLDLDKLSGVLTDALPPLDEHDLAAVAEGFERLDRRRAALEALEREVAEVRSLAGRQRAYARAVLARVAGRVRRTETDRDEVTRQEREATSELELVEGALDSLHGEREAVEARSAVIEDELDGLRSSPAYQEGGQLADLKSQFGVLEGLTVATGQQQEATAAAAGAAARDADEAGHAATTAASNLARAAGDLDAAAGAIGAGEVAAAAAATGADEGARLVAAWVDARRRLVEEVRAALAAHAGAVARRDFVAERVDQDQATADQATASRDGAAAAAAAALAAYAGALDAWIDGSQAVGAHRLRAALGGVPRHPATVGPALDRLAGDLRTEHTLARAALAQRQEAVAAELASLVAEREEVAAGGLVDPPAPAWRSDRAGLAGAPLWQLVDARPPADGLDGLEAALGAAGLLDAWVRPDGVVDLADGRADLTLTGRRHGGPTLADHLVALPDAAVPAAVVEQVLRSVAVLAGVGPPAPDEPAVAVGLDGTFRLGAAVGRGPAGPATLLGAAARERRRLARLASLDAAIAEVDATRAALDGQVADHERAVAAVGADLASVPPGTEVGAAGDELRRAEVLLEAAAARLAASREALRAAEDAVRSALRSLTATAARHQLPTTGEGIAEVVVALDRLARTAEAWANRRRQHDERLRRAEAAMAAAAQAADLAASAAAAARQARADADSLATRVQALEASIGAEYAVVVARIDALAVELKAGRHRARELADRRSALERRVGSLGTAVAEAAARREQAEVDRLAAHRSFVAAARAGFGADAGVEVADELDGVTAVLDAARAVLRTVGDPDDAASTRASSRVDDALHQARAVLGGRVDLYREHDDAEGWWTMRAATASGIRRRVAEIAHALAADLEAGRRELAAEEEQLFEQVLAGSVRRALAERIRLANQLVDRINAQLAKVRTKAAGLEVRLRWDVDPEQLEAVRSARGLLLRDPADLTEAETASLQTFVRARVEQARADLEANAPWEARLRETLDYRSWHRFVLSIGHRDWDGHRPATSKLLQRLSTGERSIALHLPMLASIAAHYTGPDGEPAGCPSLILLDELFAGVDAANRAQLFGTFTEWDLDAVFTSDHEWCQYATLDGIAIHQLHPPGPGSPVTSTRFWWDGRQRLIDARG